VEQVLVDIVSFFRWTHDIFYVFAFVVASFLLLSGTDDLALDLFYWFNYVFRRKVMNRYQHLPIDALHSTKEKPIAIFVPTWQEADVIDEMLTRACSTIEYSSYDIFVGVYPNDPETLGRVEAAAKRFLQIHPVIAGHWGPSTKAKNLNDIHQGMLRWENLTDIRYDVIVQHDAEDVIHPLSLKAFNYFIPDYDMVQLPVYPLPTPHRSVVHWTYADEFAENHTKDLPARQIFSPFVPSAGVGTAYNRWLIEFVGTSYARNLFSSRTLTEDYDIALRLALGEARLLYLYRPFGQNIATWAYFPQTFTTAVRQRTRWLIGICIQAWRNYGWKGSWRFRLTLYRDRKAVIANIINALAYVVLVYILLYELADWGLRSYGRLVPTVSKGTVLWYIVLADTTIMLWRFVHRFMAVSRIYGRTAAFLSIPRLPVSNVINFSATLRALKQYFLAASRKRSITWEKTAHAFPHIDEVPTP
jgi:adsorption protein B